jgi:hypothetical protein
VIDFAPYLHQRAAGLRAIDAFHYLRGWATREARYQAAGARTISATDAGRYAAEDQRTRRDSRRCA